MKLTIENTDKIVYVEQQGASIPARLWEGHTESGIPVQCLVVRIAAPAEENLEQFERELKECRPPESPIMFLLRMVI